MDKLIRLIKSIIDEVVQHRYFMPICFIAALIIRLGWVYLVDAQPISDFRWYYERGIDFATGKGYSIGRESYWPENLPPAVLIQMVRIQLIEGPPPIGPSGILPFWACSLLYSARLYLLPS